MMTWCNLYFVKIRRPSYNAVILSQINTIWLNKHDGLIHPTQSNLYGQSAPMLFGLCLVIMFNYCA